MYLISLVPIPIYIHSDKLNCDMNFSSFLVVRLVIGLPLRADLVVVRRPTVCERGERGQQREGRMWTKYHWSAAWGYGSSAFGGAHISSCKQLHIIDPLMIDQHCALFHYYFPSISSTKWRHTYRLHSGMHTNHVESDRNRITAVNLSLLGLFRCWFEWFYPVDRSCRAAAARWPPQKPKT